MPKRVPKKLGLTTTIAIGCLLTCWGSLFIGIGISIQNGSIQHLWSTLSEGQAQVISSGIAGLGLLTSAVLVPFIFKDRIRDLDGAVADMRGTIDNFEADAGERLERLSTLLDQKITEVERRSSDDANRIAEVLEEIRAAVILSISEGQISDPAHAKLFVQHLYNDCVAALKQRVQEKPYLREATRRQISELRTMSSQYLDKLIEAQIVSEEERTIVDRVKKLAYRHNDFELVDIGQINSTRTDFDRAFRNGALTDVDASA